MAIYAKAKTENREWRRIASDLAIFTAQRRGDPVRMTGLYLDERDVWFRPRIAK